MAEQSDKIQEESCELVWLEALNSSRPALHLQTLFVTFPFDKPRKTFNAKKHDQHYLEDQLNLLKAKHTIAISLDQINSDNRG